LASTERFDVRSLRPHSIVGGLWCVSAVPIGDYVTRTAARQVVLVVDDRDADEEQIADAAAALLAEISELDIDGAEFLSRQVVTDGSRGTDVEQTSALLVTLAGAGSILRPLIGLLRDWLSRRGGSGKIRMEIGSDKIELTAASDELQRRALDAFISRHES
jgi:hypothetical protein